MKALFFFVIGAIAGAYAFSYYQQQQNSSGAVPAAKASDNPSVSPAPTASAEQRTSFSQKAGDAARAARDALSERLVQWHLTPDEIRDDLHRTGQVVRTKAQEVGASLSSKTANTRIVAVIKAKYTLDNELSARAIEVECESGVVTLRGSVPNPGLIAKAVGLALETDGVTKVNSLLSATSEKP